MSDTGSFMAKQAMSSLFSATKSGFSAISSGISKARKSYADYTERDRLEALRRTTVAPAELVHQGEQRTSPGSSRPLERFYHLLLAGYKNELAAAAQKAGARLADAEKSSVPAEAVMAIGSILTDMSLKYGNFAKTSLTQGLQDFLNGSKMGKDHYDRDALANDLYFAVLLLAESCAGAGPAFESAIRAAGSRLVEGHSMEQPGSYSSVPTAYGGGAGGGLPAYAQATPQYAQVPSAVASTTSATTSKPEDDPKMKAAKALYAVGSSIKKAADEAELRRQKTLREAEAALKKEQERNSLRLSHTQM
eukprot:SM000157S02066  [mRNA]  locus=s157:184139:185727:+ [translate_table: standard]